MKTYTIYLRNEWVATIDGMDYAYEVWAKTKELAELLGVYASMVWDETGEVIADTGDEEDYEEPTDIDDDCGFDPYEGCYTYDC